MNRRLVGPSRWTCLRCGYRTRVCQCESSQHPREFRLDMRLRRDDNGLYPLAYGLHEPVRIFFANETRADFPAPGWGST